MVTTEKKRDKKLPPKKEVQDEPSVPADPRFPASDPSKVKVITMPPKPKRKDGAVRRESKDEADPEGDEPAEEEIKQAAQDDDFEEVVQSGARGRGRTRGDKRDRKVEPARTQVPDVPAEPEKPKVDEEAERRAAAAAALEEKRKKERAAVAS